MLRILLAEDDECLGRVYERAFRFASFDVELVRDGEETLQKLTTAKVLPDAIVMDIMMPKLNGFDLLVTLRNDSRYAAVPIVILTNSFVKHEAERFLSAGADLYFIKIEHQTKEVVEKIQELIKTGRLSVAKT